MIALRWATDRRAAMTFSGRIASLRTALTGAATIRGTASIGVLAFGVVVAGVHASGTTGAGAHVAAVQVAHAFGIVVAGANRARGSN